MKTTKRILSIVLAVVLVLSMNVLFASAAAEKGKITIKNAEKGNSYTIYKVFDATYTIDEQTKVKSVSYTTKNEALIKAIQADMEKAAPTSTQQAGTVCPFTLNGGAAQDGSYEVVHKAGFDTAMGRGWVLNNKALLTEFTSTKACTTGNTVVFDNLDLGYYLIVPATGSVATVETVAPTAEIIDKNTRTPSGLSKVSSADGEAVAIGDTVDYTIQFSAPNFYTVSESSSKQVKDYTVVDTAIGLGNISVTSIRYYKSTEDPTDPTKGTEIAKSAATGDNGYTLVKTTATKEVTIGKEKRNVTQNISTFTLPWVDSSNASLYASPVTVVIRYTMAVNADATQTADLNASNGFKVTADFTGGGSKDFTPTVPVNKLATTSLSIRKIDAANTSTVLEGAQFVLYKVVPNTIDPTATGVTTATGAISPTKELYYKWDESTKTYTWTDKLGEATKKEADNKYETQEFMGLGEGTYYLREIEAPKGYTKAADMKVEISYADKAFTVKLNGEKVDVNDYNYYTLLIADAKGNPMPSTGGTGTVLFVAIGSLLFLAAGVTLVAKKRLYNEG